MPQTLEALRAELARQDAELAAAIDALGNVPPDTELALASNWLEALEEEIPRAPAKGTVTGMAIRC